MGGRRHGAASCAVVWCALALLGPAATARAQARDCSTLGQNVFVRDTLQDIYYWYRELKPAEPALFDSPEAFLEAVRYRPLDTSFSFISGKAADDAFYSDSQFIGIGITTKLVADADYRVAQVFPDSPAADARLARGDRILEIDGRSVSDWLASGTLGSAFGPAQLGTRSDVLLRGLSGAERRVSLTKRVVTIPTVSETSVVSLDGRSVGYLHFRNFVQPSFAALSSAFDELQAAGVEELVLDLRYNGGGLVSVAQYLAGLIGGSRSAGQVFTEFTHNDKNAFRNQILRFEDQAQAIAVPRIVAITTRASASASELVINSLRPFVSVVTVGERTYGKPVGQYSYAFCEKVLHPVAFALKNAKGEGDFFDGIPASCAADDDVGHPLGDPQEASFAEALYYLRYGACSPAAGAARAQARPPRIALTPFQELVGAH